MKDKDVVEIEESSSGKNPIAQRYSSMGWAIFLILVGLVMILPHALVPEGFLWIAAGAIMLAYRAAVTARGVEASIGLVFAGVALIVIGVSDFIDINIDILPLLLIVGGILMLAKAMSSKGD